MFSSPKPQVSSFRSQLDRLEKAFKTRDLSLDMFYARINSLTPSSEVDKLYKKNRMEEIEELRMHVEKIECEQMHTICFEDLSSIANMCSLENRLICPDSYQEVEEVYSLMGYTNDDLKTDARFEKVKAMLRRLEIKPVSSQKALANQENHKQFLENELVQAAAPNFWNCPITVKA